MAGQAGEVRSRRNVSMAGVEIRRVSGVRVAKASYYGPVVGLAVVDQAAGI